MSYTRTFQGKSKKLKGTYQFYAPPVYTTSIGTPMQHSTMFDTKVEKVNPEFKDRLYLINNQLYSIHPVSARWVWNNPTGGALTRGFGQRYVKYDLMGREIYNRARPPCRQQTRAHGA